MIIILILQILFESAKDAFTDKLQPRLTWLFDLLQKLCWFWLIYFIFWDFVKWSFYDNQVMIWFNFTQLIVSYFLLNFSLYNISKDIQLRQWSWSEQVYRENVGIYTICFIIGLTDLLFLFNYIKI